MLKNSACLFIIPLCVMHCRKKCADIQVMKRFSWLGRIRFNDQIIANPGEMLYRGEARVYLGEE